MIRFRFKERLAEKEFQERRVITINEVAKASGIHRATLSKIAHDPDYNTGTDNLDRLCRYFECSIGEIVEYIPDESES